MPGPTRQCVIEVTGALKLRCSDCDELVAWHDPLAERADALTLTDLAVDAERHGCPAARGGDRPR